MEDFWIRCVKAGCVIAPVKVYSQYNDDGNIDGVNFVGIRFAAFSFDSEAVGPEYYIMIETWQAGVDYLYNTPEDALISYESRL